MEILTGLMESHGHKYTESDKFDNLNTIVKKYNIVPLLWL